MVNGHYIMYGDKPSSESEIVEDHVQTRTAERKPRRKSHRTANELQPSLAQLDNETDSVKYEKKNKEPRILRYVPNTEVEEHHVSDTFETYDLKTTDATPRRYAFKKKPKNPTDGSVNYAYSRSSSSCSSPTGNLPTISEHAESLPTHRAASPTVSDIISGYENKLDKYFNKPREVKYRSKGSHPDSLYRVPLGVGAGEGKMTRLLRVMRWPVALIAVCVALAVFVYFLMPDNFQTGLDNSNATYWESNLAVADTHRVHDQNYKPPEPKKRIKQPSDTRTPEMDFYDADHSKNKELQAVISTVTDKQQANLLPIAPVFPTHLSPEVQYGNENADTENLRSPKVLHKVNQVPTDSTLKPHITQKPEKPLAIYFKDGEGVTTTTSTEAASEAINNHLYAIHSDKIAPQKVGDLAYKPLVDLPWPANKLNIQPQPAQLPDMQEFYSRNPSKTNLNFTSGHSKLFGIGIEDAEKMQSTTQSSVYNTRVSPTLPTWRDGDDTTTKKYPVNVNQDVSQCRSTSQPLCRGVLPYDLAGKPVAFGGVPITSLLPQIEFVASTNCSIRFKTFICALLEPECSPAPYPPKMPCYNLCKAVMDGCEGDIPRELRAALNCKQYSSANCVAARTPCEQQELACGDGTCIPRDWMCDGALDCPGGEDESVCGTCQVNEFRCDSGTCIHSRWTCDGYADCPDGEDESEVKCGGAEDLGEEPAGSAPAPAVHRPNRVPQHQKLHRAGDDSSKELLITSDSNNALKRNFTRRPSLSRLTPYSPAMLQAGRPKKIELDEETPKKINKNKVADNKEIDANTSAEDQTDLGNARQKGHKRAEEKPRYQSNLNPKNETKMAYIDIKDDMKGRAPLPRPKQTKSEDKSVIPMIPTPVPTQLDQSINKLERVIDGADLMKLISQKAQTPPKEDSEESIENSTMFDKTDFGKFGGKSSAHASPCPDGELRCVDGRCITLAQLCDGTIDCSDHADEDNCYS